MQVRIDFGNRGFFLFIKDLLISLEKVIALCIDRDDERPKLCDAELPQGFGHPEIKPIDAENFFDLTRGKDCTPAGENGMDYFMVET